MSQKQATQKKPAEHPPYKDMIISAIVNLKDRNGSSRQAIKKYIHANYKVKDNADNLIRYTIKLGVEKGVFIQPKGSSGPLKLAKKPTEKKEKKAVAKKVVKKVAAKPKAKATADKKKTAKKIVKKTTVADKKSKKKVGTKADSVKAKVAAKKKATIKKAKSKKPVAASN